MTETPIAKLEISEGRSRYVGSRRRGAPRAERSVSGRDGGGRGGKKIGWVGIDAGEEKEFHWVHVLDASGRELLSRKLENDETEISELVGKGVVPLSEGESCGR